MTEQEELIVNEVERVVGTMLERHDTARWELLRDPTHATVTGCSYSGNGGEVTVSHFNRPAGPNESEPCVRLEIVVYGNPTIVTIRSLKSTGAEMLRRLEAAQKETMQRLARQAVAAIFSEIS